jgi:hypothetical protein
MPAGSKPASPGSHASEKSLEREDARTCTKTDTGGQVENTKVIEITLVKELGKIAP